MDVNEINNKLLYYNILLIKMLKHHPRDSKQAQAVRDQIVLLQFEKKYKKTL